MVAQLSDEVQKLTQELETACDNGLKLDKSRLDLEKSLATEREKYADFEANMETEI